MTTIPLTMAQGLTRYLAAQSSEVDGPGGGRLCQGEPAASHHGLHQFDRAGCHEHGAAAAVAYANRLPLLLLPGDVFASRRPDPVLQQVEAFGDPTISVSDCFRPVSRWWARITRPEQILESLPQALRVLTDPADCGPVTLALPQDVQTEAYDFPISPPPRAACSAIRRRG